MPSAPSPRSAWTPVNKDVDREGRDCLVTIVQRLWRLRGPGAVAAGSGRSSAGPRPRTRPSMPSSQRQREGDGRSLSGPALGADLSAVRGHEVSGDGEAEPGAPGLDALVETIED